MHVFVSRALLALALLSLSLPLAAKERAFSPVASDGQEVRFSDGQAVLITGNGLGNIGASLVPIDKKWCYIRLWVENASDQQFNVGEASLTATAGGAPLQVMTYADQVKAQKRKEIWVAVLTGIAAGANSYAASQAGYSTYYGSTSYGSFYGRSYNGGIAYLANANAAAQNQAMFDRFSSASAAASRSMQRRSLKLNTLMPGQSVLGDIKLALPRGSEMIVRLDIAGKPVEILFREGPPVFDSSPRPVVNAKPSPNLDDPHAASPYGQVGASQQQAPPPVRSMEAEQAKAQAYAHPSGASARREFVQMGCDEGFSLFSTGGGKAIFEATCPGGKRQLVECYGSGCRAMN